MNYFIFDYNKHAHLIESFLESAALAHNHPTVKNLEWFIWKFRNNPYGETILACVEENNKIIGCVAYGIQPFSLKGKKITGALAFENFVHPKYQGKGIFKKLIFLSERETKRRNIKFLLVFPNKKSLPGYQKMHWRKLSPPEYWIKGKSIITIPSSITDLKKSFRPRNSNLSKLSIPESFMQSLNTEHLTSLITLEYLQWRFFTLPISEYHIINNQEFYAILRIGHRGKVKEAQVLFVNYEISEFCLKSFLRECKTNVKYDLISFPISEHNPLRPFLKKSYFIKVPNKTNICFKILNENEIREDDIKELNLSGINYHTY